MAADDFGTGHCSLSYLQKFPVDYLKIDKGFVHAIQPDGEEAPVLDVIIMLAHRLGLSVVAEGVEQRFQFDYLTERGVAFIQGYLFSRPCVPPISWPGTRGNRGRSCRINRRRAGRRRALQAARARLQRQSGQAKRRIAVAQGPLNPQAQAAIAGARSCVVGSRGAGQERATAAPGPAARETGDGFHESPACFWG